MRRFRFAIGAGCALYAMQITAAAAEFEPFVSFSHIFEDNVFSFKNEAQAEATIGTDQRYDNIFIGEVGFLADHQISRQTVFLRAELNHEEYVEFNDLSNTGWNVLGGLDWAIGRRCSGVVTGNNVRLANSQTEFQQLDVDDVTRWEGAADAACFVAPDVRVRGDGVFRDTDHGDSTQSDLNRRDTAGALGVDWLGVRGSTVGLTGRVRHTKFPDRDPAVSNEDDEHIQYYAGTVFEYFATRSLLLSGDLGWTWRVNENRDDRDFDDFHGNVAADWAVTAKTSVGLNLFRDVGGTENLTASATEDTGVEVDANWAVTRRISLRGAAGYTHRKFIGADNAGTNQGKREDDRAQLTVGVDYNPYRNITASVEYRGTIRDSNVKARQFTSNAVQTTLRVTF